MREAGGDSCGDPGEPDGLQHLVGDIGTTIVRRAEARVLLARALYKQPKILVLDEATSHLDIMNERAVNEAIKDMKLTRIVVAHRPETSRWRAGWS